MCVCGLLESSGSGKGIICRPLVGGESRGVCVYVCCLCGHGHVGKHVVCWDWGNVENESGATRRTHHQRAKETDIIAHTDTDTHHLLCAPCLTCTSSLCVCDPVMDRDCSAFFPIGSPHFPPATATHTHTHTQTHDLISGRMFDSYGCVVFFFLVCAAPGCFVFASSNHAHSTSHHSGA